MKQVVYVAALAAAFGLAALALEAQDPQRPAPTADPYANNAAAGTTSFPLAAPQGRAEDVSLKAVVRLTDAVDLDLGYRLLEGGADNDEVYTFAFFHYAVVGLRIRF